MNGSGRILYINHDCSEASGGVKTIYRHVSHLVKNGYPAFVVHSQPGFRPPWLKIDVPLIYLEKDFQVFPNDILVIPEDYKAALEAVKDINAQKHIFCQNHFYIFNGLQDGGTWEDFGISSVFCSSEIISDFIRSAFGYTEVPVVHYAIPLDLFKPGEKKLQIAYMPRKRPVELKFIRNLFRKLYREYEQVPWVCIDGMEEENVAEILGESALFLSLSLYEGFGLPPIEAMASGCIVVGFHGYGGLEYARNNNGFWCEEGNMIECAWSLGQAVSQIVSGEESIFRMQEQALKTAGEYDFARQEREQISLWNHLYSRNVGDANP